MISLGRVLGGAGHFWRAALVFLGSGLGLGDLVDWLLGSHGFVDRVEHAK